MGSYWSTPVDNSSESSETVKSLETVDVDKESTYKIDLDYCLEDDLNKTNSLIFKYSNVDDLREQLLNYEYEYAPSLENLGEDEEQIYILRQEAIRYILEKLSHLYYLPKVYFVYKDADVNEIKTILQIDYITCPIKSGKHAFTVIFNN